MLLQLPGRMVGRVSRAEVSDELHSLCETGDPSSLPDLRKHFKVRAAGSPDRRHASLVGMCARRPRRAMP